MIGSRFKKLTEKLPEVELASIDDKIQLRYDFKEIENEFMYSYIYVKDLTKKEIKKTLIHEQYDYDDEIALMHLSEDNPERLEYNRLRSLGDFIYDLINNLK